MCSSLSRIIFSSFSFSRLDCRRERQHVNYNSSCHCWNFLDRMNTAVSVLLVLLHVYCSQADQLLGGWSTSSDQELIDKCLSKALVELNGGLVDSSLRTKVSNIVCKTQIVNGLNIRLSFDFGDDTWQCSYYKSFNPALETQLEQCKRVVKEDESSTAGQPFVPERDDEEDDDEAKIDALNQQVQSEGTGAKIDGNNQALPTDEDNVKANERSVPHEDDDDDNDE